MPLSCPLGIDISRSPPDTNNSGYADGVDHITHIIVRTMMMPAPGSLSMRIRERYCFFDLLALSLFLSELKLPSLAYPSGQVKPIKEKPKVFR